MLSLFGRKSTRKSSSKKTKPTKALRTSAKKNGVRTTRKVNGKRVYKDARLLKKQINKAKRRAAKKK